MAHFAVSALLFDSAAASFSCSSSMPSAKALFPLDFESQVDDGGLLAFMFVAKLGGHSLLVFETHQQATFLLY